jgi:DNA polymerase-4
MGKLGIDIYSRIRGIDERPVNITRERKSVGKERTLKVNTLDKEELLEYIKGFSMEISEILKVKKMEGRTVTLKYKTGEFESHTRSKTLNKFIQNEEDIFNECREILEFEEFKEEIRLIGVSISSFKETKTEQLTFFE